MSQEGGLLGIKDVDARGMEATLLRPLRMLPKKCEEHNFVKKISDMSSTIKRRGGEREKYGVAR